MLFDKQSEKKFIIGVDLRENVCQISYAWEKGGKVIGEPVTYSETPKGEQFDLPMALCRVPSKGQWYHASEAALHAADAGCIYIPKLLSLAMENVPVKVEDKTYEAEALLALYLGRCLAAVREEAQKEEGRRKSGPDAVMFTTRRMDQRTIDLLESIRKRLDLQAKVYYQSTASSFYDFTLSQESGLREPATALVEYEQGDRLRISKLIFDPHTRPVVSYMEEKEYPGLLAEDSSGKDKEFEGILREELSGHHFSSVYLTGSGFEGGWIKHAAVVLCQGRRAFVGSNLFSKGAVYGCLYKLEKPSILREYFFLDQNKLRTNILIKAYRRGQPEQIPAVDAGINWYEVQENAEVILDGTAQIDLVLKALIGGKEEPYHLRLDRLPVREGRMTRVRMEFTMNAPDKLCIHMEDLGFGEIFPSSGLVWEQTVSL